MAFLEEADYKAQLKSNDLAAITDNVTGVRLDAEIKAQAEMESYLRERFKVAEVFGATGDDRNPLIKMFMVDITIYHMFSAVAPRNIPQIRVDRYNAAILWLDMARKGSLSPNLPLNTNNDGSDAGTSIFGSNPQNSYNW